MDEKIKKCWSEATFASSDVPETLIKRTTALQSLIARYKYFSILGLTFSVTFPMMTFRTLTECGVSGLNLYLFYAYGAVFFLLSSGMDRWLVRGISRIDITRMPVAEVCGLAFRYRKMHLRFMAILMPLAIILFGWMAYLVSAETYLLYGMATGAVIGLLVGTLQLRKFMASYRNLTD